MKEIPRLTLLVAAVVFALVAIWRDRRIAKLEVQVADFKRNEQFACARDRKLQFALEQMTQGRRLSEIPHWDAGETAATA